MFDKSYIFLILICCCVLPNLKAQDLDDIYRIDNYVFECPFANEEIQELYQTGIKALNKQEHINIAGKIFFQIIQKDNTLCDAYYFTGVALTKQNKHKAALSYYYYADSLAVKSNAEFKEELAEAALRVNNVGLARKKYEELTKDFPEDPDGYYGIGLTATSMGDFDNGLAHLNIAEEKYKAEQSWTEKRINEVWLMKAILYTMNEEYKKAMPYFEQCQTAFGTIDDYLANYALAAYHLYLQTKEPLWKQKCQQTLEQLKGNEKLKQDFFELFQF